MEVILYRYGNKVIKKNIQKQQKHFHIFDKIDFHAKTSHVTVNKTN